MRVVDSISIEIWTKNYPKSCKTMVEGERDRKNDENQKNAIFSLIWTLEKWVKNVDRYFAS